jgi:hypothetical protein
MRILLALVLAFSIMACKKSGTAERVGLIGKWQLSESLWDPGDLSGRWQPVDPAYRYTIEFRADSTFSAPQGLLAGNSRFRIVDTNRLEVYVDSTHKRSAYFLLNEKGLELRYSCIEPCGERFVPVN